ncbi:MAG: hypothetical protein LBV72_06875 [Tannerella sp.]|jgi:hypothetical protein|nr:hypothetical protein [Tannerella sp.]
MDKDNINTPDSLLKEILADTKIKAGKNLKYRIMQQIETEKVFSPQKVKNSTPLIGNMFSIFGIMYALIAMIGIGVYLTGGKNALESITFLLPVTLVASVCSIFWMISTYDDQRRSKQQ